MTKISSYGGYEDFEIHGEFDLSWRCEMREVVVTTIRYSFRQRREVVFKLTYRISEGPSPDLDRWFLVSQEEQEWQDSVNWSRA